MGCISLYAADCTQDLYFQGFEEDASGWFDSDDDWYGTVSVYGGNEMFAAFEGDSYAVFEGDASSAPFSWFDGPRDTWPGTWSASVAIYLDPDWDYGTGFDYSVASWGSDGNHQRDFIFHVTSDTSSGKLLVAGSNNTNFAPREDLENINHYQVDEAGWYVLEHVFYDLGGSLAVDLNLYNSEGGLLFTETRFNAADTIPDEVGGNGYGWFTFINVPGGIAVDAHRLALSLPSLTIDGCETGVCDYSYEGLPISEWIEEIALGARNHGQFVSGVARLCRDLMKAGVIRGPEKGAIISCAAQSSLP